MAVWPEFTSDTVKAAEVSGLYESGAMNPA
jgi:hypothetical protein